MKTRMVWIASLAFATIIPGAATGCKGEVNPPGPAEKAGRAVDDAVNQRMNLARRR